MTWLDDLGLGFHDGKLKGYLLVTVFLNFLTSATSIAPPPPVLGRKPSKHDNAHAVNRNREISQGRPHRHRTLTRKLYNIKYQSNKIIARVCRVRCASYMLPIQDKEGHEENGSQSGRPFQRINQYAVYLCEQEHKHPVNKPPNAADHDVTDHLDCTQHEL